MLVCLHVPYFCAMPTNLCQFSIWQQEPAGAPNEFALVSLDATSVTLTWDEVPCSDQNGPILGHVIRYTPDGGTASTAELPFGNNQLIGLASCTRYTLMVAARNDAGIGIFSPPLPIVTSGIGKC